MKILLIALSLSLMGCEAHRLGAQVSWEYGAATLRPTQMDIGGKDEDDNRN